MTDRTSADKCPWPPRMAQEARLRQLDAMLANPNGQSTSIAVERAVLLGALGRSQDAQAAFVDILRRDPSDFSALNEFGGLLTAMGAVDAATRVYSEAVAHHPVNPIGHVNLANLLYRSGKHAQARETYQAALRLDPDHPQAHQGLGAVLADLGEREVAQRHFRKGFAGHAVLTQPYRGTAPPVTVLQLISSGGGNIPTTSFLDDRTFLTTVIVADHADLAMELPSHHLVFNAIGDVDLCRPALEAATELIARTKAPVINDPRYILPTGRIDNARMLGALSGVVAARTVEMPKVKLESADALAALAQQGFAFPVLLRSPGYHTGRNFVFVETALELSNAASSLPGDTLLVMEFLNARGQDGNFRKYRAMMIDGAVFPLHLAISRQWKVHYFTADMADNSEHRLEESKFLADMEAVLGKRAMSALQSITRELALDYGGIDFGIGPDGDVLLFEANATMVVIPPTKDSRWAYRETAVRRILDAVIDMILKRAGSKAG